MSEPHPPLDQARLPEPTPTAAAPANTTAQTAALPPSCDVLVIGAGPAGSACAFHLAQAGLHVVLVDQHVFPRDKICGDGLIPDSHAALRRLGVFDEVAALWKPVDHVRCVAPRGHQVDVPGALAVLPRKVLDEVLVRNAQRAGAQLAMPWRFEVPLEEGGRVVGARFKQSEGEREARLTQEVRARWVVLATGAVPQGLMAAGQCERHTPSGVALRGYVKNDAMVGRITQLQIVWHPALRGGYGWIFPAPGGLFNIGAGLTGSHDEGPGPAGKNGKRTTPLGRPRGKMQDVNLRHFFERFCEVYAPARELMASGTLVGELKGAPLRCSLAGASWSRPGLLVTGEAAGSTYAFTGEGIGKAMETGLLAAEAVVQACRSVPGAAPAAAPTGTPTTSPHAGAATEAASDTAARAHYESALHALKPRFDLYVKASYVNQRPWMIDLLLWRAAKSAGVRRRMTGVLEETSNPGSLVSWRGIKRLFFE
jgi:menaquinone-9 beta-reductase